MWRRLRSRSVHFLSAFDKKGCSMPNSDFFCRRLGNMFWRLKNGFCHCTAVLQMQVPKLCTALDLGLLYILILGTYSRFARKHNFLSESVGVCFPQLCSSAGRRFAASTEITCTKLPTNRFISTIKISMKYVVNLIPLRICVRSRYTQPYLKVGLGIVDFCAISRRLISKIRFPHPISVAETICGTRSDLRDSKRRALKN